jgi:hypothetical protein
VSSLASLSRDLFLLGHAHVAAGQAGEGSAFERRVRDHLDYLGLPNASGFRVLGRHSISGIYHQLDEQTKCGEALVIGEWKAYRGTIPKNDLLRFKAATDDYWLARMTRDDTPVVRIFGGTGRVTNAMRVYAAQWGIVLVTPDRWPVPALCDGELLWSDGELTVPSSVDRRTLSSLVKPFGKVLIPQPDRSWRIPPVPVAADVVHRLEVWEHHSDRAWHWWDDEAPSRFESLLENRTRTVGRVA